MVSDVLLSNLSKTREPHLYKAVCSVHQKGLHRMYCFELVYGSQCFDSVFLWLIYPQGNSDSSFSVQQFCNSAMVSYSLFKGNSSLAESSSIRYTQCFLYNCFSLPLPIVPPISSLCASTFFSLQEAFKKLLLHGDAYKYSVYNQEVGMQK